MKKITLLAFFLNIAIFVMAQQTAQDSVYKIYQTKKVTYTKINLGIPCTLDDYDRPCILYKQLFSKSILKYWRKHFKYLNYIYKHKIEDIDKVSPLFLKDFEISTKNKTEYNAYYLQKNNIYITINTRMNKIISVDASMSFPNVNCCNKQSETIVDNGYLDFRLLDDLNIKIPLRQWNSNYDDPVFGWDYTYYQKN